MDSMKEWIEWRSKRVWEKRREDSFSVWGTKWINGHEVSYREREPGKEWKNAGTLQDTRGDRTREGRTREGRSPERRPCAKKWETQKRKWVMTEEKGGEKEGRKRWKKAKKPGIKYSPRQEVKKEYFSSSIREKNKRRCPCSVHYYCWKEKKKREEDPSRSLGTDIIIIIWSNIISRVIEREVLLLSNRTRQTIPLKITMNG